MAVFYGTNPNLNYAVNKLNQGNSIMQGLIGTVGDLVDDIFGGAGAQATSEMVENAVLWAIDRATNYYITYSQTNRNLKNVNGTSFDCSSFIITAFYAAGLDVNASTTANMRIGFISAGFRWISGSSFTASQCQRGDILLAEASHTQMYIGNNQDVNCGSTPARVQTHVNSFPWDGILRFDGD